MINRLKLLPLFNFFSLYFVQSIDFIYLNASLPLVFIEKSDGWPDYSMQPKNVIYELTPLNDELFFVSPQIQQITGGSLRFEFTITNRFHDQPLLNKTLEFEENLVKNKCLFLFRITETSPSENCYFVATTIQLWWTANPNRSDNSFFANFVLDASVTDEKLCSFQALPRKAQTVLRSGITTASLYLLLLIPICVSSYLLKTLFVFLLRFRPKKAQKSTKEIDRLAHNQQGVLGAHDSVSGSQWEIDEKSLTTKELISKSAKATINRGSYYGKLQHYEVDNLPPKKNNSGHDVAVKSSSRNVDRKRMLMEIKTLKAIGYHEHLLALLGCLTGQERTLILTEFCSLGDLRSQLRKLESAEGSVEADQSALIKADLPLICLEISDALAYLCSIGIIHRSVRAESVLLNGDKVTKLSNFSEATFGNVKNEEPLCESINDDAWAAVEVLEALSFSEKSDVWSFGVLIWEVTTLGDAPYAKEVGEGATTLCHYLLKGLRLEIPIDVSSTLKDIMTKCWQSDPSERPRFIEILAELQCFIKQDEGVWSSEKLDNIPL